MKNLQKFKIKDGELVACKRGTVDDDSNLLLINEVLFMLKEEMYNINNCLLDPRYKDVSKLDEWDKKQKYALESKQLMVEEFIRKINE